MPYCIRCGNLLDENTSFCPKCGTPVGSSMTQMAGKARRQRRQMEPLSMALIALAAALVFSAVIFAVFSVPLNLSGAVVGSRKLTTQEENIADFTNIKVNSGFKFDIVQSNSYRINVTADDNLFSYIEVTKTGDTLSIDIKPGYSVQATSLKVEITMPDLHSLDLNGGANGNAVGFASSHEFTILSSGGSAVKIEGEAHELAIEASGGSRLDLSTFHVSNANVNLSGGSQATINLDGKLDADLSGGSRLQYVGNPTLGNINTSGGATLSKK